MSADNSHIPEAVLIVDSHLGEFIPEEDIQVLHEKIAEGVHSDVYIIRPDESRDFYLLVSCGLSTFPMKMPDDEDGSPYAEVMMLLPPDWNMAYDDFSDEDNYWPLRALKYLMLFPHINETWLGNCHSMPLDNSTPANHNFTHIVLINSPTLSGEFSTIEVEDKTVNLFSVIPLYTEEMEYILANDVESLMKKFVAFDISEIVDIQRANTCA